MLPLGGNDFPKTRDDLARALAEGLALAVTLPAGKQAVTIANEAFPALTLLRLDLTGGTVRNEYQPARPKGPRLPAITAARFEMIGRPIYSDRAAVYYDVFLNDARFEYQRDSRGRNLLVPADAASGRLLVSLSRTDLDALLLAQLRLAAREYGVTLDEARGTVQSQGERSLSIDLRVSASKGLGPVKIPASLRARGTLTLDDQLNARLSGLSVEGEGVVGTLVVSLLQGRLQQFEGHLIPLASYSLGRLKLHDLRLRCDSGLEIEATFGSG